MLRRQPPISRPTCRDPPLLIELPKVDPIRRAHQPRRTVSTATFRLAPGTNRCRTYPSGGVPPLGGQCLWVGALFLDGADDTELGQLPMYPRRPRVGDAHLTNKPASLR